MNENSLARPSGFENLTSILSCPLCRPQRKLFLRILESGCTAAGHAAKILQQNPETAVCFVPMVQSGVPVN